MISLIFLHSTVTLYNVNQLISDDFIDAEQKQIISAKPSVYYIAWIGTIEWFSLGFDTSVVVLLLFLLFRKWFVPFGAAS